MRTIARRAALFGAVLAVSTGTAPATAQGLAETASASEPEELVRLLRFAGWKADLGKSDDGTPRIRGELLGWTTTIYFFGCDGAGPAGCDSLLFSTGFDREQPMDPVKALELMGKYRFATISLDDEGDPFVDYDLMLGTGIPSDVFLAVHNYAVGVDNIADVVFALQNEE
jgi:hypothetical protein